jgi:hypothetical protein
MPATRHHGSCYGARMKDRRVAYVRSVLTELVESLDATMRIARWPANGAGAEAVPAPLRASVALLVERLGKANRLAADKFVGSPRSVAALTAMSSAITRLDRAYVAYLRDPDEEETAIALGTEIARVRADTELDLPP